MMKRRDFLQRSGGVFAGILTMGLSAFGGFEFGSEIEEHEEFVTLYDTYAMALYMDGGLGPKTGIIKVDYLLENKPLNFKFWHGHGGKDHQFSLSPENYADLKLLKKVTVTTTSVEGHTHKLFVDMNDPRWRVPGAQPVKVPKAEWEEMLEELELTV